MRHAVTLLGVVGALAAAPVLADAEPARRVALFPLEGDRDRAVTDAVAELLAHDHTVVPDTVIAASQARQALNAWRREVMPRLDETMEQTTRAYQAGEVSLLAVHEVARERVIARFREADLAATARRAQAELERSVGRKLEP